jgi:hypothetical protein
MSNQPPAVARRVWRARSTTTVEPDTVIPLADEFPPVLVLVGLTSSSSDVEQDVKKETPKAPNTAESPAFSINFLRDSLSVPLIGKFDFFIAVSWFDNFRINNKIKIYSKSL